MNDGEHVCEVVEQAGRLVALCPEETFGGLVRSVPHWQIELLAAFVENTVQFILMGIIWKFWLGPFVQKHWQHHLKHDDIHEES